MLSLDYRLRAEADTQMQRLGIRYIDIEDFEADV
jgi:hypothetical protein